MVRRGYDRLAQTRSYNRDQFSREPNLNELSKHLGSGAEILDVGCGSGVPVDKFLLEQGHQVTGIDISAEQIKLAKANLPKGTFFKMDMTKLNFPLASFDAVVSFYAIFHIPREEHLALVRKFARMLKPGGYLLVTMGAEDWEGTADFHGVEMFWSHYGRESNLGIIREAGFQVLTETVDTSAGEKHLVVLAKKSR